MHSLPIFRAVGLAAVLLVSSPRIIEGQTTPPAKKAAPAPAAKPAAKPAAAAPAKTAVGTTPSKPGSAATASKTGITTSTAGKPGITTATAGKPGITTTTAGHPAATTTTSTAGRAEMSHSPAGGPGGKYTPVGGVQHGNLAHPPPRGSADRVGPHGEAVRVRANGRPADIHRGNMDIHHNLAGGRRLEVERADHSRLYYERGRPGYIAHPYDFHGHEYDRRTYYYNGRAYDRFYNRYEYRPGVYLDVYTPARFYGPGFYGWAYNPWAAPVPYAWGFAAAPWYGYYGAYFTPYPVYASPSLWLTDYLISTSLAAAYEAHVAAQAQAEAAGTAPPAPLTPEAKQMIADEVQRQIARENAEAQANGSQQENDAASSSIARILSDGRPHVFVPGKEYDVTDAAGQECAVSDGDVLQLSGPPAADATAANLTVVSSKGGVECPGRDNVSVPLEDLQDMQNHMRETVDQGLQELQAKQGTGGLPPAPQSATAPPVTALVAQGAPPPDPAGAQDLAQQAKASESEEQAAIQATAPAGSPGQASTAPATAPKSVSIGQTKDEVIANFGPPLNTLNGATKTTFVYKDMKVVFVKDKVSDVE